jgi:hypothetical protein
MTQSLARTLLRFAAPEGHRRVCASPYRDGPRHAVCRRDIHDFAPRLRDLGDRKLYTIEKPASYPELSALIGGTINVRQISEHWEDLLRLTASLRLGTVTASLMLRKLASYPRQNGLAWVLREVGRIEKTLFVTEALAAGDVAIPPTIRDAVLARAARLAPAALTLLEAVAIAPPQAELWLLDALAGGALDQLDACLSSGILTSTGAAVRFRHELARLAIEKKISPPNRHAPCLAYNNAVVA